MWGRMKLSWRKTTAYSGWAKYIGKNPNGKPRCFYLGKERLPAEIKAAALTAAYKRLQAAGIVGWTNDAIQTALAQLPAPPSASSAPQSSTDGAANTTVQPSKRQTGLGLHDAIDQYLAHESRRAPSQVSYAHLYGVRVRVNRCKKLLPDKPLAQVGYDDLAEWVALLASRPVSRHTKQRLGAVTAHDAIKGMRAMFDWFDLSNRWVAPRRFERIFKVKRRSLMDQDEREREHEDVETFTVEELRKIMEAATNAWQRVFIATALNLAMTQRELAALRRRHFKGLDTDNPYVEKAREKTDIFCRWGYLFPEVTSGVRSILSGHDYNSVFVTSRGNPPVRFTPTGRQDKVMMWWRPLVARAGVRLLGFRFLRKTAADMVRKLSDRDTSEAMLAHANDGMAAHYTNHDWGKLTDALKKLYEQLQPIFEGFEFSARTMVRPNNRGKRARTLSSPIGV